MSGCGVHYIRFAMKRIFLGPAIVAIVAVTSLAAQSGGAPSGASTPMASHTIRATKATMADLRAAFLKFKIHNKEMVSTDRITWGQVIEPRGPKLPLIAYDGVDHREWAIASFNLVMPASYAAKVSFQDGGNMGIFNKIGTGRWFMTGSPGVPLCAKDVPSVVAHLWGLVNYPACS